MREALFIRKNKKRWDRLQHSKPENPDEMARDFIRLVDDLAYAKTFYNSSKVTVFINALAARIYLNIYQNRKEESNRLITFWKYDLPLTIYKHRRIVAGTFILFAVFFAVGFFSAQHNELFIRQVLGDGYVDMTEENIEAGNPFGVYQSGGAFYTWMGIMINNIIVSFMYFVKGILLGVLTVTSIVKEAIRLGAFEQYFFARGLGFQSVITVFIHGTLEIAAIIFAGAAGIIMGTSYLFPRTYSRLQAFKQGTKDGLKIVIGLVPIFIIAAFFEGYVTRHYKMPAAISISILMISLFFIIGYFIIYPWLLVRNKKKMQ